MYMEVNILVISRTCSLSTYVHAWAYRIISIRYITIRGDQDFLCFISLDGITLYHRPHEPWGHLGFWLMGSFQIDLSHGVIWLMGSFQNSWGHFKSEEGFFLFRLENVKTTFLKKKAVFSKLKVIFFLKEKAIFFQVNF